MSPFLVSLIQLLSASTIAHASECIRRAKYRMSANPGNAYGTRRWMIVTLLIVFYLFYLTGWATSCFERSEKLFAKDPVKPKAVKDIVEGMVT